MAQTEDTELRDLVIEALEKNGSLAKIRALLRANIFLAFENECENIKQNVSLDHVLKLSEESRQKEEYLYEGRKFLEDKLNKSKGDSVREPILVTLLKNVLSPLQRKYVYEKSADSNFKDEQNCTYIVHEDSSSGTSNSQSDNSCDEKNKLHLRLQLDNSDTDTSSDSARDKSSSEYIPNAHVIDGGKPQIVSERDNYKNESIFSGKRTLHRDNVKNTLYMHDLKVRANTSSSESTSYLDLKPFNPIDKKLLNTPGVPIEENNGNNVNNSATHVDGNSNVLQTNKHNIVSPVTLSSISSVSGKNEDTPKEQSYKNSKGEPNKSDGETEYSYDFTGSPKNNDKFTKENHSSDNTQGEAILKSPSNLLESPHQNSQSSQSSVSLSDVADLISEKSSFDHQTSKENRSKGSISSFSKKVSTRDKVSDDSGDFSESPVPSLSNLSLDLHSD